MNGMLYGIGVGPGDPTLLTIRAKQLLEEADRIFIPVKQRQEESKAFEIVRQAVDIPKEKVVEVVFAMKRDRKEQERGWNEATKQIVTYLEKGETAALITLGDVSIYSTAFYVCDRIKKEGFCVEIVPGIPSFCAGAAQLGISLVEGKESFLVIPSFKGIDQIKQSLQLVDTLVIMKAAKYIQQIEDMIQQEGNVNAYVLSNIGMEQQYIGTLDSTREYGYLTTVILKKER